MEEEVKPKKEIINYKHNLKINAKCYLLFPLSIYYAALAQMVACLPLVQQGRGSIPGGVVNFHLKIFNPGAMGGDVHFLIARLYITGLD